MSSPFPPAPKPKSPLGYHRLLSPTAGVRVSPLCLGTMTFGEYWKEMLGECDKKQSYAVLDHFYQAGGNFLDTANNYQAGQSETWIGEWMAERGNRDEMVIATKYTTGFQFEKNIKSNYQGNHSKSLRVSVETSLKNLQTAYIDVLYIHWWDFTTSVPELMQSLHHLVAAGKILYLGVSDTPAWVVSKANQYARDHALTQFSVYQGKWSAASRDFERDIIPMCEDEGMAMAPWGALGSGFFKTDEEIEKTKDEGRKRGGPTDQSRAVSKVLNKLAHAKGSGITGIALRYVMHKSAYVYPIVGVRKVEHLQSNIEALNIDLTDEEIDEIDSTLPFDVGFPMTMLFEMGGDKYNTRMTSQDMRLVQTTSLLDTVQKSRAPKAHEKSEPNGS
ncbi:MAG: hypothetical protein L6R37_007241 [Teloschistes peruensis]|nr:MAG: hypothetical protein L6R37_007241 [Teloschistes peruensis]